jgi:hypothetical protein
VTEQGLGVYDDSDLTNHFRQRSQERGTMIDLNQLPPAALAEVLAVVADELLWSANDDRHDHACWKAKVRATLWEKYKVDLPQYT